MKSMCGSFLHRLIAAIFAASILLTLLMIHPDSHRGVIPANHSISDRSTEKKSLRLLCWVTTMRNLTDRQRAISETWGRRCSKLIFVVGQLMPGVSHSAIPKIVLSHKNIEMVEVPVAESYDTLHEKTRLSLGYIYSKYGASMEWFLKADDDTYIIVEHLHLFLQDKNFTDPHYFGCQLRLAAGAYNSGGAGYVLSQGALVAINGLLHSPEHVGLDKEPEDVYVGQLLNAAGIQPGYTLDALDRHRFIPFPPTQVVNPASLPPQFDWFHRMSLFPMKPVNALK